LLPCPWSLVSPVRVPGPVSHLDHTTNDSVHEIVASLAGDTAVYGYKGDRNLLGLLTLYNISPLIPSTPVKPDARINADRSIHQPDTLYYTSGTGRPFVALVSRDCGLHWKSVKGNISTASHNADLLKLVGNPLNESQYFLATSKGVFRSDDGGLHW